MDLIPERPATLPQLGSGRGSFRPRRALFLTDILSALLAGIGAYGVLWLRHAESSQLRITLLMAVVITVLILGLLVRSDQYTNRRRMSPMSDVGVLIRDMVISAAIATLLSYLTKGYFTGDTSPSRLATGSFVLIFLVLGTIFRCALGSYQHRLYAQGRAVRKILLLGSGPASDDFLDFLERRPWLGVTVAGRLSWGTPDREDGENGSLAQESEESSGRQSISVTHLDETMEGLRRLDRALRETSAAEIVVALDPADQAQLPHIANLLSVAHVPFKVVPSLFEHSYRATELLGYAEIPVIDVEVDALDRVARLVKRTLDVSISVIALIVLLPLELGIMAAVVAESGLPMIYRHQRVGKNGRLFTMFKFRTMVKDADDRFKDLESKNEAGFAQGRIFKMRKDPRVTRVGAILRKLSLDELPQLVNVLRGEMSVVGPRPPLPREVEQYEQEHLYRLKAFPGITGLWQVSGRSDLDFEDMIRLDRYYLDNWSVALDMSILFRTLIVMVTRKGAY